VDPPPWILREIERRARNVLAREPTGDVDLHELASLALEFVTKFSQGSPYRSAPSPEPPGEDEALSAMATLERQLEDCRAELQSTRRDLETLRKR
jgi:hypothetical protein